ncbi:hypothetical protein [Pseudomonas sp. KNUC1026]|uniref:hypothetical protein n=1 Tax=Pseudomonas sp. KNUC1026 TaxID=2893890 RepID=UPI001F3D1032|nr:hypothetical protein [Pseudomonas sp. KNUC1026]UFH49992.1 hypothetical protein LN139_01040 [Pseudomonas sp. KNUC1026]
MEDGLEKGEKGSKYRNAGNHKGSLSSPGSLVLLVVVFLTGFLFLFNALPVKPGASWDRPLEGGQEQTDCFERRIEMTSGPTSAELLDRSVVLFAGCGGRPENNTSPKESVSCASCRLVLVMREPIRVVFVMGVSLVIVLVP